MVLLRRVAKRYASYSMQMAPFAEIWDAVFLSMDVEALNGLKDRLTEFGLACLDPGDVVDVHNNSYGQLILTIWSSKVLWLEWWMVSTRGR